MSNNDYLEYFELPRLDWHDAEGRINKTALIDNFNAIEEKMHELINLPPIGWAGIDFNTFDYDDTTLASDDNRVVNLKSLIDIMNLKGVIINCSFNGKKLTTLQYYNNNYQLITIQNVSFTELGNNSKNYIYLDYTENMVYISADEDNANNDVLVGIYSPEKDTVFDLNDRLYIDCNVLEVLSRMKMKTKSYDSLSAVAREDNVTDGKGYGANAKNGSKRTIGIVARESTGWNNFMTFRDLGV